MPLHPCFRAAPVWRLGLLTSLAWRAPAAARLQFTVQGKFKGLPYQTRAQLDWLPQGQRYEAAQEVQIPVLGSRRQSSVGSIGPQGLQPEIFLDRSRKEYSTTFDAAAGQIRFSRGSDPAPWQRGTQDRMSVFFQVARARRSRCRPPAAAGWRPGPSRCAAPKNCSCPPAA